MFTARFDKSVEEKWLKRFQRLPPAAVDTAAQQVMREAVRLVAIMRSGAPVGDAGVLINTVRIETTRRTRAAATVEIRAGGPATTVDGYDYSFAVEFGTEHQSAQPFFFPAYRLRRKAIRSAIRRAVTRGVKAEFAR
jgi:HK97 gp10 family phage protein